MVLIIVITIAGLYYSTIFNIPSSDNIQENQNLTKNISEYKILDSFSNSQYKHWGHMPLTYKFENECRERLKDSIISAFNNITRETGGLVYFNEAFENADFLIECKNPEYSSGSTEWTLADAIYKTDENNTNLIIHADINIYGQGFACVTGYPSLEVHEILHVFGFLHNPTIGSIMEEYVADSSNKCKIIQIDKEYISCLKNIYSNGGLEGNCSSINTLVTTKINPCPNGRYLDKSTEYCCPYPNMIIDIEGNCVYN